MLEDKKIIGFILVVPIFVGLLIATSVWQAWFCMDLWNWFIVPYFDLKEVDMLNMFFITLGLKCVSSYSYTDRKGKEAWVALFYKHMNLLLVWVMAVVSRWYFL